MVEGFPLRFLLISHLFILGSPIWVEARTSLHCPSSTNFTIENKCDYTVWPVIRTTSTNFPISTTGFVLKKGEARVINAPSFWSGYIWGRSHCSTSSTGSFSCATGDCGSGKIECPGVMETSPATAVGICMKDVGSSYYVSVATGYNLPLAVVPLRPAQSDGSCSSVRCMVNLSKTCPSELKVGAGERPVACMSAIEKCNGTAECKPTVYSQNFKRECPSVSMHDSDQTFSCISYTNYLITFCPSTVPNTTRIYNWSSLAKSQPECQPSKLREKKKSSWKSKLIRGVLASLSVVIIIVVGVLLRAKNKRKSDWNDENIEAAVMLKRYSYARVKKMTNSFAHVLGKGGFGTVYKGKLPDEGVDVAIKILKVPEGDGEEFINEVASLSRTSHVNIVSLLGFCYEGNKRAIIYEVMPNGSLDKFISKNMSMKMEWERLYDIAVGVSRGLEYLHNRCGSRIVHFDIKPQNILIDKDLCPKISDFGLAKLCKNKESIMSMLYARGTAGYIAPEVFSKNFGGVSHKSDVYSYGMVVLEMIGARNRDKIENSESNNCSVYFPDWIYKDFKRGEIMRIFGDHITEEEEKIAKKMVLVGLWCIQTNPSHRPTMIKVIEMLEGSVEAIQVPPKPVLCLPATTVLEVVEDNNETSSSFSSPSQCERGSLSSEDSSSSS